MSDAFSGFDPAFGQAEAAARRLRVERERANANDHADDRREDGWDPATSPLPEWKRPDATTARQDGSENGSL